MKTDTEENGNEYEFHKELCPFYGHGPSNIDKQTCTIFSNLLKMFTKGEKDMWFYY